MWTRKSLLYRNSMDVSTGVVVVIFVVDVDVVVVCSRRDVIPQTETTIFF